MPTRTRACRRPAPAPVDVGVWNYATNPTVHLHSWASLVLPYLEDSSLQGTIDYRISSLAPGNRRAAATVVPILPLPVVRRRRLLAAREVPGDRQAFAIRNYVALGATTVGTLWGPGTDGKRRPDGTIYYQSDTRLKDVTDGLSHTVLIGETREQDVAVWIDGTGRRGSGATVYGRQRAQLRRQCDLAQPRAVLCLGRLGRFDRLPLRPIEPARRGRRAPARRRLGPVFIGHRSTRAVYDALVTRAGGEVQETEP